MTGTSPIALSDLAAVEPRYRVPLRTPEGTPLVTVGLRGRFDGLERERALLKVRNAVPEAWAALVSDYDPEGQGRPFVQVVSKKGVTLARGPVVVG